MYVKVFCTIEILPNYYIMCIYKDYKIFSRIFSTTVSKHAYMYVVC